MGNFILNNDIYEAMKKYIDSINISKEENL